MSTSSSFHNTCSFGEFTLDLDRGVLIEAGADVKLRPKSFQMLCYLVERQGLLVTKDELLEVIWGDTVVTEGAITQCIKDIRSALRDKSQKKILTVPRRGFIFELPVTKNNGLISDSDAPPGAKFPSIRHHWLPVAVFIPMLALVGIWWLSVDRQVSTPVPSIAVLPFEDMSPEQDQAYFAEGIAEEILNQLAHIPGLRVIARTSSFSFKGQNVDIATISERLKVTHVLEGSVRKSSNRIRITAQLVDTSSSEHIWSETYDRELENALAVQDDISATIVGTLEGYLGFKVEAMPRVIAAVNIEAHDAYLRGRHLIAQRTPGTIEGAIREFEKAILFDPGYALAHSELALAILLLESYTDLTAGELIARASPHVWQAMDLDPTLAEAHAAMGLLVWVQENAEEALIHFRHAIEINPNYSDMYLLVSNLLDNFGRYNEAFTMLEKAVRLDPLSIPALVNYVHCLDDKNRLTEADRELEKLASIDPFWGALTRQVRTARGGNWTNALFDYMDALQIDPESVVAREELSWPMVALDLKKEVAEISRKPRPTVLSYIGRSGAAVTTAQTRLAQDPIGLSARRDLGMALASAGDYARARPVLEHMWQRSAELITRAGIFRARNAAALIVIRRDAGEEAGVDELVAATKDNVRRYREAGISESDLRQSGDYEEGLVKYLAGERESGLVLITRAVADGFYVPQRQAYLQTLYEDPGFAPIRKMQEDRQIREREKFLRIVCNDNPYVVVWQPAESTCESFGVVATFD